MSVPKQTNAKFIMGKNEKLGKGMKSKMEWKKMKRRQRLKLKKSQLQLNGDKKNKVLHIQLLLYVALEYYY